MQGFTLIELLVVIAIIGLLVALLTPVIQSAICSAEEGTAQTEISDMTAALDTYKGQLGIYPKDDTDASSIPLVQKLGEAPTGNNAPFYNFDESRLRGGTGGEDGAGQQFYSPLDQNQIDAYEYHYTVPKNLHEKDYSEYTSYEQRFSEDKGNEHKPNLWTAGCNWAGGEQFDDEVNNW